MVARRTASKIPDHVRTQSLAAVGMLGVTPVFGSEEHLMKLDQARRHMEEYMKHKCAKCKTKTPNLGLKIYEWLCKNCYVGPKTYSSNEE